jgi:hypothetical protein
MFDDNFKKTVAKLMKVRERASVKTVKDFITNPKDARISRVSDKHLARIFNRLYNSMPKEDRDFFVLMADKNQIKNSTKRLNNTEDKLGDNRLQVAHALYKEIKSRDSLSS